jgi:hypothetical protein
MKANLLTILITIATPFICFSQREIKEIDESIQGIKNNKPALNKIEKINSKDETHFVFLKDKDLQLISVKSLEPTTEKNVEWYFIDGQLAYAETNWFDTKTKNNTFNEKCYLNKGHLISWTNSRDKTIDTSSDMFKKMDTELVAYGKKIKYEALK